MSETYASAQLTREALDKIHEKINEQLKEFWEKRIERIELLDI